MKGSGLDCYQILYELRVALTHCTFYLYFYLLCYLWCICLGKWMPFLRIMENKKIKKFCREEILDKLIAKLDRKLCEARKDKPFEETLTGMFTFGKHAVRFYYRKNICEVEVWNPTNDCLLDNVSTYCETRTINWDNIEIEETDEWDLHGFRDEADYIRWKYC